MAWENGCTVIVMLSPLVEDGVKQCDRYWPDEGSSLYHIYEVSLPFDTGDHPGIHYNILCNTVSWVGL